MTENPTILAIDSSLATCSVAIYKNSFISEYYEELTASAQAKNLIPMIESALKNSNISYPDLSLIAVSIGPGSFTGIRIALSTARAIGFAANIPVLGFNSLQIIAYGIRAKNHKQPVLASLNAGKGEVIHQTFNENLLPANEATLIAQSLAPKQTHDITFPRADLLALLAAEYPNYAVEPHPFYVRPPDAKLPSKANA